MKAESTITILISTCLLGAWVPGAVAQNSTQNITQDATGIIRGIVVNEEGAPVEEAEVRPEPVAEPANGTCGQVKTLNIKLQPEPQQ